MADEDKPADDYWARQTGGGARPMPRAGSAPPGRSAPQASTPPPFATPPQGFPPPPTSAAWSAPPSRAQGNYNPARNWIIGLSVAALLVGAFVLVALVLIPRGPLTRQGTTAPNVPIYDPTSVAAGTTAIGWFWGGGTTSPQRLAVVAPVRFTTVVGGDGFFVALDAQGSAWTWGSLTGVAPPFALNPTAEPSKVPLPPGVRLVSASTDDGYVLAIDKNGHIWGWGRNVEGELGIGTVENSALPVEVHTPPGVTFTQVSAGRFFALALDSRGRAWTWGEDDDGVVGDGNAAELGTAPAPGHVLSPVVVAMPAGTTFRAVATGDVDAMALDSAGHVWTWGLNEEGQLGVNASSVAEGPGSCDATVIRTTRISLASCNDTPVEAITPPGVHFVAIAAGSGFDLALDSHGRAWSWGSNVMGQLGFGGSTLASTCSAASPCSSQPEPVSAPQRVRFSSLTAAGDEALAIDTSGDIWGWGSNAETQLGRSSGQCVDTMVGPDFPCSNKPIPLPMPSGASIRSVVVFPTENYGFPG